MFKQENIFSATKRNLWTQKRETCAHDERQTTESEENERKTFEHMAQTGLESIIEYQSNDIISPAT